MYRPERIATMDIHTILRMVRAGKSNRHIADTLRLDRRTVGKYRRLFVAQGLLTGELPDLEQLNQAVTTQLPDKPKGRRSSLGAWEKRIAELLAQGLGPRLVYQKLAMEPGFTISEAAIYRFARRQRPQPVPATVRVETPPGQEAQVDFGDVGQLWDAVQGRSRRAWVFTLLLSWSRHMYVEFVFDQRVNTWLECHRRAFEFLGGVPARLKIDNLKAGISRACFDDPQVQRAYAECALHYGFRIDPCRPRKPEHKGKVERGGVAYVKRSLVPLLPANCPVHEANAQARGWVLTTAGQRDHGTTHVAPLVRFASEQAQLLPLPPEPFIPSVWKVVTVHRDCHVVFEKSYYSAPFRLVTRPLQLRATPSQVELYDDQFQLVALHPRAATPGERHTLHDHLPPEKVSGLQVDRTQLLANAQAIGPQTAKVAARLLDERPLERSGMVQRILRLADAYGPARLEAACGRGLYFDDIRYRTLQRMLQRGLDQGEVPQFPTGDGGTVVFARSPADFVAAFMQLAEGGAA